MTDYMMGDKDSAVAVPFSDDESADKAAEELDEEAPSSASPEERVLRKQKRQDRIKRILDEGKQNAAEVKNLRDELTRLSGELERTRGFALAQSQRQQTPRDEKDPYEARLDAIYEKQTELYNAAQAELKAGSFTPERQKYYEQQARSVESEKTRVHTERAVEAQAQRTTAAAGRAVWEQKYPEVYGNPQAHRFAHATWERRKALGEVETPALLDEVMQEAMTQFKLGPKRAPTASEKSRMSGVPAAGGGGGSTRAPGAIEMSPSLRRMAVAAYSDLPEAEALKKWANGPGKRLREKKVL